MANQTYPDFKIVLQAPSLLMQREGNPRTHDRKQQRAIVASIRRFGFNVPILIDNQNVIIAGHARAEAAAEIGMTEIPTICVSHLSQAELNAYVIADNRTAELGGWDKDLLAISLASIGELESDSTLQSLGSRPMRSNSLRTPKRHDQQGSSIACLRQWRRRPFRGSATDG